MEAFTNTWNSLMSIGTLVLMALGVALLYALVLPGDGFSKRVSAFVSKNVLWIGFLVSLAALVSSQVYEHVIGYAPCMLCWYARVAFYPMALIFLMAIVRKDRKIVDYMMGLTVFGLIVTAYHSIITVTGESPLPCSSNGVSCLTRYVYEYGFISIPLMAFVSFAFLFLVLWTAKRASK